MRHPEGLGANRCPSWIQSARQGLRKPLCARGCIKGKGWDVGEAVKAKSMLKSLKTLTPTYSTAEHPLLPNLTTQPTVVENRSQSSRNVTKHPPQKYFADDSFFGLERFQKFLHQKFSPFRHSVAGFGNRPARQGIG